MSVVNPTGTGAWDRGLASVSASSSGVIYTVTEGQFRAIKFIITFFNLAEDKTKTLEFMVHKESGTIKTTVYNKIGNSIGLGINAAINSGSLEVTVTNNETFDIQADFGYLSLGRG